MAAETIEGSRVVLRGATEADIAAIEDIMRCPGVEPWWGDVDVEKELGDPDNHAMVIQLAGSTVGYIQYYEENDPMYRHAQIDVSLHDRHQGQGLGTDAVHALAGFLLARGHHRLTIDPAAANERAIRCYTKVGFRPVGVMRDYERGPDGTWRDGLLMDLLAGELR